MKHSILLLSLCIFSCISCSEKSNNNYALNKGEKKLYFSLDKQTRNFIQSLFIYKDKDSDMEYLTFQNEGQNDILFYDILTQQLIFRIKPEIEGNNGVGFFLGYHIHNLDSIFLTVNGTKEIALIDANTALIEKIQYEITKDSIPLERFYSTSALFHPIEIINNNLYIVSGANRWAIENPVTAYINLKNKTVSAFTSLRYPQYASANNPQKRAGSEESLSRCFDGEKFVYSFFFDDEIVISSIDHKTIIKKKVKSKFINKIELLDDFGNLTFNNMCENPNYGNLLFDEYRNIYYRIAYPETEVSREVNGLELMQYGRKNFSIVILDEDFNIIGETLFPDYTYNSTLMFIREEGLYISDSHYLNPEFSDDVLSFQLFELISN